MGGGRRLLRGRGAAPPRASAGARAPGRGRAHLCAGSFAPRGRPWGSPPRPTAPRVLAVASAARPLSGIPVATPVGAARLLGRVRLIIPRRSLLHSPASPRVRTAGGTIGSASAKVTRVGPGRCPDPGLGTRRRTASGGGPARLVVPFRCFLLTLPGGRPGRKWCQVESALLCVLLRLC